MKGMVQKKFMPFFNLWLRELESFGYVNHYSVLNAKDYGVPQNRERLFLISIRDDGVETPVFRFPAPIPLERHLVDVLEDKVDERFYVSDVMI